MILIAQACCARRAAGQWILPDRGQFQMAGRLRFSGGFLSLQRAGLYRVRGAVRRSDHVLFCRRPKSLSPPAVSFEYPGNVSTFRARRLGAGGKRRAVSNNQRDIPRKSGLGAVLQLYYNGALLHEMGLRAAFERFGTRFTGESMSLELGQLISSSRSRPYWETFRVIVVDANGQVVFEQALCLVRRLSIRYEQSRVRLKVPNRCNVNHPDLQRESGVYYIPTNGAHQVEMRVSFPALAGRISLSRYPGHRGAGFIGWPASRCSASLAASSQANVLETLRLPSHPIPS